MKITLSKRILSFLLAVLILCSSVPLPVASAQAETEQEQPSVSTEPRYDYDTLQITQDGQPVSILELQACDKHDIFAEGLAEQASYQWQVLHPEREDVWVNIYDGTQQSISVTMALVSNVLREDGTAQLRCRATTDDYIYISPTITVKPVQEAVLPVVPAPLAPQTTLDSGNSGTQVDKEFVTITVNYLRYDYVLVDGQLKLSTEGVPAFTPYVATITYGGDLGTEEEPETVTFPTIVGYESYLVNDDGTETQANSLKLVLTEVKDDIVYTVRYRPKPVKYVVHYFFQNIYDDNYVEDAGKTVTAEGETGSSPDKDLVSAKFDGFTTMYYEPDVIAADGSTVFEVYYERNYYLMDFDCNGGYGADPVYVRYGTYISVPNPVRSGWTFGGWDLVSTDQQFENETDRPSMGTDPDGDGLYTGDDTKDILPETMPCYNTAYKAIWTQDLTTYTVAYWLQDGDEKTFLGSRAISALTGSTADGKDDYFDMMECGIYYQHAHEDGCYSCGETAHTHHSAHTTDCYNFDDSTWTNTVGSADQNVINATNTANNHTPQNGDIYFIYSYNDLNNAKQYWPKIYWNGAYYTVSINGSTHISISNSASIVEDGQIGNEGSYDNLYAIIYRAKTTCGLEPCGTDCAMVEHSHTDCTISCGKVEHMHDDSCYAELRKYVAFDSANTETGITVEGDASTVVNVYYTHKTYVIRYVYARAVKGTDDKYSQFEVCTSTLKGTLEDSSWVKIGETEDVLPQFTDPDTETTDLKSFDRGNYRYYYVSVTAHFGDDISEKWPANNDVQVSYGNSTYTWGSWAAEVGTTYRDNIGQHANVVGSYPTMSAEMISNNELEVLDEEKHIYVAQNMIAWWSGGTQIGPHSYHNYFEVLNADIPDGITSTDPKNPDKIGNDYYVLFKKDGENTYKTYKLETDTFVANHDGYTHVGPFEFIGFDWVNTGEDLSDSTAFHDSKNECTICGDACDYCNVFFFTRTPHRLYFWNLNKNLEKGDGSNVLYGTSLYLHGAYFDPSIPVDIEDWHPVDMDEEYYPEELEPGAYFFNGWYTSPECLEGTEMAWTTATMPDSDFTVYANWDHVVHDVYFYYDYEKYLAKESWTHQDKDGNTITYPIQATHGDLLQTTHYKNPTRDGYAFVGWFYLDDNGKKRFAPESMEIRQELHLFAEWISETGEPTTYNVRYIGPDADGNMVDIADPTTGYSTAGKTKTFNAKGDTDLHVGFQEKYFPQTASHSILMGELYDDGTTPNTYTFTYVRDEIVYYKIRYVDAATNKELDSTTKSTTHAVVTERYLPITGYVPMPGYYYQTKSLSSDGEATEPIEANTITFYYMADEDHGAYSIEYYVEDQTDSSGTTYTLKTSFTNTADLKVDGVANVIDSGTGGEFSILEFNGYAFSFATVTTFNADGTEKETVTDSSVPIEGTLDTNGLTIKLYYSKKSYPYTVKYMVYGSDTELYTAPGTAAFNEVIEHTAPETYEKEGTWYNYYLAKPDQCSHSVPCANLDSCYDLLRTQSMTIRSTDNGAVNELVFYYIQRMVTVNYVPVCKVPGATGFGSISFNSETGATASALSGSTATAGFGYKFAGWYSDEACTNKVSDQNKFKPNTLPDDQDEITYYALFEPVLTTMTITSSGPEDTDSVLVRVVGEGKFSYIDFIVSIPGSNTVTLENMPMGTYTVTLLTDWSWTYSTEQATVSGFHEDHPVTEGANYVTFTTGDATAITFTSTPQSVDWLQGENHSGFNP